MENERETYHRPDTVAIREQSELRASDAVAIIEQKCTLKPVAFLKANLDNKIIRYRATEPDIRLTIGIMMIKISAMAGIKTEIDMSTGEDIARLILSFNDDLTVEEVYKAFELERYGIYTKMCPSTKELIIDKTNHFQLFNADYVSTVISKYRSWKILMKKEHNISKQVPVQENKPDAVEVKKIMDAGIIRIFEAYVETKEVPTPCIHIFLELYQRKIFPYERKHYDLYYSSAERDLKIEYQNKKPKDIAERNQIKETLESIYKSDSEIVKALAAKYVLQDFFQKLIDKDQHIENLI